MYEMIKEFIRPELIVLIPVMYLLGTSLKKSEVKDKHIPWLLGFVSITLSTLFVVATSTINGWQEALICIFTGLTQGVLCAGASVYANQIAKQYNKDE